ncbi:MAG: polyprenyl synthetase family protein [Chloroflexi bacterium]|jgi:geranylgeranyl diphosphate synthase type I|nr:polyprenyl synthetase family protein [Chloroflexota bacterium]
MNLVTELRNDFEKYFKETVLAHTPREVTGLRDLISYHFGWEGTARVPGKRLRPIFLLLTYSSFGGAPHHVYNPAVALEVLHNYTLIHDDIEDNGKTRHGQPALWIKAGMPLAINAGDYLASLSHTIMGKLPEVYPYLARQRAIEAFQKASLEVIQGQQLDITYESYSELSVDEYLKMIRLKTSRLFASAMTISARLQDLNPELEAKLDDIGERLGLGFQIQDDYLGIWGESVNTGKSVSTDLLTRKKTYPALIGLQRSEVFRKLLKSEEALSEDSLIAMKTALEECGAKKATINLARNYYQESVDGLTAVLPKEWAQGREQVPAQHDNPLGQATSPSLNPYGQAFIDLLRVMFAPSLL